jgi:hypothetical protein
MKSSKLYSFSFGKYQVNQVPNLLNSEYNSLTGCILHLYFIKREYSHTHISTLKVAQISYNPVSPLRAVKSYC